MNDYSEMYDKLVLKRYKYTVYDKCGHGGLVMTNFNEKCMIILRIVH